MTSCYLQAWASEHFYNSIAFPFTHVVLRVKISVS